MTGGEPAAHDVFALVERLPEGHCEGRYRGRRYAISTRRFNHGRSFKVFGRALDGSDVVSLNGYRTARGDHLRPCEMTAEKVLDFLRRVELTGAPSGGPEPATQAGPGAALAQAGPGP